MSNLEDWREEFDEKFPDIRCVYPQDLTVNIKYTPDIEVKRVKNFIETLLIEAIESVEVRKESPETPEGCAYNRAVEQLEDKKKQLIKEIKDNE